MFKPPEPLTPPAGVPPAEAEISPVKGRPEKTCTTGAIVQPPKMARPTRESPRLHILSGFSTALATNLCRTSKFDVALSPFGLNTLKGVFVAVKVCEIWKLSLDFESV